MLSTYRIHVANSRESFYFLPQEIIRLQAHDNYTFIYVEKHRPFVMAKVLKCYEEILKPFGFLRTHRSHLVNPFYVKSVSGNKVEMQDASVAGLSRRRKLSVIEQLGMVLP